MSHKILKSLIYFLLLLSFNSISYANDTKEADQAVTIIIYNYSGSELELKSVSLKWGRWGATPEHVIGSMQKSWYSIKGKTLSGPEATVVYKVSGKDMRLLIWANSDHWNSTTFYSTSCLSNSSQDCQSKLGDYEVLQVQRPRADSNVLHHLDVYIKNVKSLPFENLCKDPSKIESNVLINGVVALDGKALDISKNKYNRFYGVNDKIMSIVKIDNSPDIVALDLIKTAYLTGMKVTYCPSSANSDDLGQLIIRK